MVEQDRCNHAIDAHNRCVSLDRSSPAGECSCQPCRATAQKAEDSELMSDRIPSIVDEAGSGCCERCRGALIRRRVVVESSRTSWWLRHRARRESRMHISDCRFADVGRVWTCTFAETTFEGGSDEIMINSSCIHLSHRCRFCSTDSAEFCFSSKMQNAAIDMGRFLIDQLSACRLQIAHNALVADEQNADGRQAAQITRICQNALAEICQGESLQSVGKLQMAKSLG